MVITCRQIRQLSSDERTRGLASNKTVLTRSREICCSSVLAVDKRDFVPIMRIPLLVEDVGEINESQLSMVPLSSANFIGRMRRFLVSEDNIRIELRFA